MPTISEAFGLNKSQRELDFVNVRLDADTWLAVDPFAISQREDPLSTTCHRTVLAYFQRIVDSIREGNDEDARSLLSHLREPNETRLGLSKNKPQGAGIGSHQAGQLMTALKASSAVKSGFLSSLEECELMIEGIGHDKISDLTTNVIRGPLLKYTLDQSNLHNIPVQEIAANPEFDINTMTWNARYALLPVWDEQPILLIPKAFTRRVPTYDHRQYYHRFVLDFLEAEELNAGTSLVRILKNQRRIVLKKDLEAKYPLSKRFLYEFSKAHPEVLAQYRDQLTAIEAKGLDCIIDNEDDEMIAKGLSAALLSINPGMSSATQYHKLMIGIVEFIFFPNLFNPIKEQEIHEGRKRIDILMENCARGGIFHRLHEVRNIPCSFIPIECKNYSTEVANPELDQISSRFSTNRGRVGILCCRQFEDRHLFIQRCRDTFRDGRGLVFPLEDTSIVKILGSIGDGKRSNVDDILTVLVNEVYLG